MVVKYFCLVDSWRFADYKLKFVFLDFFIIKFICKNFSLV